VQPIGPKLLCHYHPPSLAMGWLWRVLNLPNLLIGGKKQMQQKIGQKEFSYMDPMLQLHSIARCLKGDDCFLLIVDSLST
jgi:hypothetical protein